MKIRQVLAASAIALAALGVNAASAVTIIPVLANGSSSYPGYEDLFAIDQGPNSANTDWAANGSGAGSYLDLNLGAVYALSQATVSDRVTSGGGNGTFVGGLSDFTTQFTLQAYDSSFTTPIGSADTFNVAIPGTHNSPADFTNIEALSGITGQYVRYTVDATQGVNPGLSNIFFAGTTPVPEPSTLSLLGAGFLGLGGLFAFRRRNQSRDNA